MRSVLANRLLAERGLLLHDFGFRAAADVLQSDENGHFVFYHYTHEERLEAIFAPNSGLYAWRAVACPSLPAEFANAFLTEGFLSPLPEWLSNHPYFQDLGMQMVRRNVGSVLLQVALPKDFPGLYVADFAHVLECKYAEQYGSGPLGLGYDCSNGQHPTQGYVNSYVPLASYKGGHVAPVVQVVRRESGIAIPNQNLSICSMQPLA
ncbi:hypothetical protein MKX64_04730 [Paenibacillus sp. FSL M8-0334]|uniref:hypothetical protein n=1 Tax=Paenibacillus sp. FSL M8-0334 TaxID=2921623 RepID=UPI0030F6A3EB